LRNQIFGVSNLRNSCDRELGERNTRLERYKPRVLSLYRIKQGEANGIY
jgi:hypothetical protein